MRDFFFKFLKNKNNFLRTLTKIVVIIIFKTIIIIMDTSVTNTCSSSIVNTNIIIPKTKHKMLQKNKRQKKTFVKTNSCWKKHIRRPKIFSVAEVMDSVLSILFKRSSCLRTSQVRKQYLLDCRYIVNNIFIFLDQVLDHGMYLTIIMIIFGIFLYTVEVMQSALTNNNNKYYWCL